MKMFDNAANASIVFLCAPAGFGKSVSTRLWLQHAGCEFSWIGLDEYDNATSVFYRLLGEAILLCAPDNPAMEEIFHDPSFSTAPVEHTIRGLSEYRADGVKRALVLDDYHLITNKEIRKSLPLVLMRLPQPYVVVITSRNPYEMETRAFSPRNGGACISTSDLRFKADEARDFFSNKRMPLSDYQIDSLLKATGGWAFGINAVSQADVITSGILNDVTLNDYLNDQIWDQWDKPLQDFLLKLSVVDEINPELVALLTQTNSAQALALLEEASQKSAFILPVADGVYRCHSLFLRFLREKAAAEKVDTVPLHEKATEWYLSKERYYEARHHAILSGDAELMLRAVQISQQYTNPSFDYYVDFFESFNRDELPDALLNKYPFLLTSPIVYNYLYGDKETLGHYLDRLYGLYPYIEENFPSYLEPALSMSVMDPRVPATEQLDRFKDWWAKIDWVEHVTAASITFHFPLTHRSLLDYSELTDGKHFDLFKNTLGHMAKKYYPMMEDCIRAGLRAEQLLFAEAAEILKPLLIKLRIENDENATPPEFVFAAYMLSVLLEFEMGNVAASQAEIRRAEEMIKRRGAEYLSHNMQAVKIRAAIERGQTADAKEWLELYGSDDERPMLFKIYRHLTSVRAHILMEDYEKAEACARTVREIARNFRRPIDAAESGVLVAICRWQRGDREEAALILRRVIREILPFGFLRVIADEGKAVQPILRKIQRELPEEEKQMHQAVSRLLTAAERIGRYRRGLTNPQKNKPITLTRQQAKLLALSKQGLTRAEIAETMGLSVHTVKAHLQILYRKLGVHSAMEAILKAEQLGIA
jgi:LuxR family maltose regulon positive regulatory protein